MMMIMLTLMMTTSNRRHGWLSFSLSLSLVCAVSIVLVGFVPMANATAERPPFSRHQQEQRRLIIQGETAPAGRYPYFTAIEEWCGGALIAPDIVITAGHCKPSKHQVIHPRVGAYLRIDGGSDSAEDGENDDSQDDKQEDPRTHLPHDDNDDPINQTDRTPDHSIYTETDIIRRHPDWVEVAEEEYWNDVLFIKLDQPVFHVPVIRINRDPRIPADGQDLVAMGLGDMSADPDQQLLATVLQHVTLQAITNRECELAHSHYDTYKGRIQRSHLCTRGGPQNQRDSCDYDSGSPIIVPGNAGQNVTATNHSPTNTPAAEGDILVGLVSWGESCADPHFPAVNTRISDLSGWIDRMVCRYSDYPPNDFHCPGWELPTPAPTTASHDTSNNTQGGDYPIPDRHRTHASWLSSTTNRIIVMMVLALLVWMGYMISLLVIARRQTTDTSTKTLTKGWCWSRLVAGWDHRRRTQRDWMSPSVSGKSSLSLSVSSSSSSSSEEAEELIQLDKGYNKPTGEYDSFSDESV